MRKILWSRKWQPTPVFLPGEFHGHRSLTGYSPLGSQRVRHNWACTNTQRINYIQQCFTYNIYTLWVSCWIIFNAISTKWDEELLALLKTSHRILYHITYKRCLITVTVCGTQFAAHHTNQRTCSVLGKRKYTSSHNKVSVLEGNAGLGKDKKEMHKKLYNKKQGKNKVVWLIIQ